MNPRPTLDMIATTSGCAAGLPTEVLTELLAQTAAVQSALVASLLAAGLGSTNGNGAIAQPVETDDRMLTVAEAAALLRKKPRWIYRSAKRLPWVKRLSGKSLLCSEQGLRKWLASARVKP